MAISDLLTQLNGVKQAIKQAISNKGVSMSNVPFTEYASKINGITTPVKTQTVKQTITLNGGVNTTFSFTFSNLKTVYGITNIQKTSGSSLITTYSGYPDPGTGGNSLNIPSGGISGNTVYQRFVNNSDANNQSAEISITAVGI